MNDAKTLDILDEIKDMGFAVGIGTRRSGWGVDISDEYDELFIRAFGLQDKLLAARIALSVLKGQTDFWDYTPKGVPAPVVNGVCVRRGEPFPSEEELFGKPNG